MGCTFDPGIQFIEGQTIPVKAAWLMGDRLEAPGNYLIKVHVAAVGKIKQRLQSQPFLIQY